MKRLNTEIFIEKSRKIHNNKYDYNIRLLTIKYDDNIIEKLNDMFNR